MTPNIKKIQKRKKNYKFKDLPSKLKDYFYKYVNTFIISILINFQEWDKNGSILLLLYIPGGGIKHFHHLFLNLLWYLYFTVEFRYIIAHFNLIYA